MNDTIYQVTVRNLNESAESAPHADLYTYRTLMYRTARSATEARKWATENGEPVRVYRNGNLVWEKQL